MILSRTEILTSIKGHTAVTNKQKMTGNNLNLNLVNINAYTKCDEILSILSKDFERKRNSNINQGGHNSVIILQKMTGKNPNLVIVNINVYTKFDEIMSTCSKDIDRKRNSDINQGPYLYYKLSKNDR